MDAVRPYRPEDKAACLALFDGNTPDFFTASERDDFDRFLDASVHPYLVIERNGRLVACGGYAQETDHETVGLCWGMVERSSHRAGLGRRLTEARLDAARATPGVRAVRLDTSQHTEGFYRRFGFVTYGVTPDGYGAGLHRHDMKLSLTAPTSP